MGWPCLSRVPCVAYSVTGVALDSRVSEIIRCETEADEHAAQENELGRRAQAEKDGPGSKTWGQIADEFGCDRKTLLTARETAGLSTRPRSPIGEGSPNNDLESEPQPDSEPRGNSASKAREVTARAEPRS